MSEVFCEKGTSVGYTDRIAAQVVTAAARLLSKLPSDDLFRFLHELHIKFSLTSHDGKFHCRLFQQERGDDGNLTTVREFIATGKAPQFALRNAIAEFLVRSPEDYHTFVGVNLEIEQL